jgi:TolB-like protein/Tfp pilus assembly protein PilF
MRSFAVPEISGYNRVTSLAVIRADRENSMGEPSVGVQPAEKPLDERLDSWKEIAAHLNRDVTTVQRWEKREGMPVHRHLHDKRGSVYAVTSELDAWLQSRRLVLDEDEDEEKAAEVWPIEAGNLQPEPEPRRSRWIVLGALTAAVALLGLVYVFTRNHPPGNTAHGKIQSLAVLPLKNLSGDPSQDYLADGLTEAIIGRLAGIHDLRVISHTSVMRLKNSQLSVPEIAKTFGVDALVEGSVMREGDHIRVTAQLIRGSTDTHFWSETYDREFRDVLPLESDLAQSIAEKIEATVTGEEHQRLISTRPVAPEVYENYLKGRFALNSNVTKAGLEESIRYFQEAIRLDPTFALPYLGEAKAWNGLGLVFVGVPPDQTRPKVLAAARKALELDPNLAEAHVWVANVEQEQWHWAEAEAEYRRALELAPNDASANAGFSLWLLCQGRTDEALQWIERGRALDPIAVSGVGVGWVLFQSRLYDEAIREYQSVLAVQPGAVVALWNLGFVLIAKGKPQDAVPYLEKAVSLSKRNPAVIAVLIRAYAQAGRRNDALRVLAELKDRSKKEYVPAGAFVNAYSGLGNKDDAFAALDLAYKEQSNILQFVKVHPFLDPLRDDPRFKDLLRRVGLS